MDRRKFLTNATIAGLTVGVDPVLLWASVNKPEKVLEKRQLGKTGQFVTAIGFGGMILSQETPANAANYVAEAVDRGVMYFDVAPAYKKGEELMGPALKPYRDSCFLSCKTWRRDAEQASQDLHTSLERLQTDHFDLYQLHAIEDPDGDVEKAFGPGGAMETVLKAREEGKIRYLGITVHSPEAANAALDRFDFDTIMLPINFSCWNKGDFGPRLMERARKQNLGVVAIKTTARQEWESPEIREKSPWKDQWYEPYDKPEEVALCLRFALSTPGVHSIIPPGNWTLFKTILDLVQSSPMNALDAQELAQLEKITKTAKPLFRKKPFWRKLI